MEADRGFDSAGVPIRCVERGAGEPVLLAHSYCGNFDDQFVRTGFAAALAQGYRVIGFDLRGHGASEAQIRERSARYLQSNDLHALAALRRSNRDQVVTDAQMAAITIPVLGVVGSEDPYLERFRELQSLLPQLQLVVIKGARHDNAAGRPEFLRAVRSFLDAHARPR